MLHHFQLWDLEVHLLQPKRDWQSSSVISHSHGHIITSESVISDLDLLWLTNCVNGTLFVSITGLHISGQTATVRWCCIPTACWTSGEISGFTGNLWKHTLGYKLLQMLQRDFGLNVDFSAPCSSCTFSSHTCWSCLVLCYSAVLKYVCFTWICALYTFTQHFRGKYCTFFSVSAIVSGFLLLSRFYI